MLTYDVLSPAAMKDTTISFKIDRSFKAKLVALAQAENRTLSNYIENILREAVARTKSRPLPKKATKA